MINRRWLNELLTQAHTQKMIGTVPLMQLCLANFEVVVAPGSGEPFAAGRASESCGGGLSGGGRGH
jgi:hypothetical protein